jgi:hypothetical protein
MLAERVSPRKWFFIQILNYPTGVDVMITIFCDLSQFSSKELALFSKTSVMINFFSKSGFVLRQKRQFFR